MTYGSEWWNIITEAKTKLNGYNNNCLSHITIKSTHEKTIQRKWRFDLPVIYISYFNQYGNPDIQYSMWFKDILYIQYTIQYMMNHLSYVSDSLTIPSLMNSPLFESSEITHLIDLVLPVWWSVIPFSPLDSIHRGDPCVPERISSHLSVFGIIVYILYHRFDLTLITSGSTSFHIPIGKYIRFIVIPRVKFNIWTKTHQITNHLQY